MSTSDALTGRLPAELSRAVHEALDELESAPGFGRLPEAPRVLALSDFVRLSLLRRPALCAPLAEAVAQPRSRADYHQAASVLVTAHDGDEAGMMAALRQLRTLEMLRIAWRDLAGLATLEETLAETSWLAEACIEAAETWSRLQLEARHGVPRNAAGEPQRLVVLGMGKLGGEELNFSSDVDLIFAWPEPGETDGPRPLDNQQFFTRQGQLLIRLLNERTAEGFVFRVDMRLRPFGDSGALVWHFAAMEDYYLQHGREWERYALVKARVVGGDREAGARLLETLRPFVYRRYLDYAAIDALAELKRQIDREARRRGEEDNLKLGPGGIREIEFIVQAFQLVRGGQDAALRGRHLMRVLPLLAGRGLLPEEAVAGLLEAYRFLRLAENHLQMLRDEQVHRLPDDPADRLRLALAQGFADETAFLAALARHRRFVRERFEAVFASEEADEADPALQLWQRLLDAETARVWLRETGFDDPERVLQRLASLRDSRRLAMMSPRGRGFLDRLMPRLLRVAAEQAQPETALARLLDLIEAVAGRSTYLALLADNPQTLALVARLFAASPWVAEQVTRHPILLDELIDPRQLAAPPDRAGLAEWLGRMLEDIGEEDTERFMERLRQFRHGAVLRVAVADLIGALPVMRVSDHLTWIAELVLERALDFVWRQLERRHGAPRCEIDGREHRPRLLIVGYGKLGGYEMGYGSDLDIVFLHDSAGSRQQTDGERPLENAVFFARVVQRLVSLLTTLTPSGTLYEVDMRLRPSGSSGLLVSSLQAFERYQREEAWTWEHQALVRARAVVGPEPLQRAFESVRAAVLARPRDPDALREEVRAMRARMWCRHAWKTPGRFDLKRDPGGITDIEFMVQYAVLAHAAAHPALLRWTDNVRLLEALAETGVMEAVTARRLADCYRLFRDTLHHRHLAGEDSAVPEDEFAGARDFVRAQWRALMGAAPFSGRDDCTEE